MGLKSPAVDRLIDVVLAAKTKDELTVATKALDRVLRPNASGCRNGTRTSTPSPITTCSNIPRTCRPMRWASWISGGTTPDKAAALKAAGALK